MATPGSPPRPLKGMQTFPHAATSTKVRSTPPHNGDMWVACGLLDEAVNQCPVDAAIEAALPASARAWHNGPMCADGGRSVDKDA